MTWKEGILRIFLGLLTFVLVRWVVPYVIRGEKFRLPEVTWGKSPQVSGRVPHLNFC